MDILLIKWTEKLKNNEPAFNLHSGMIALEVQQKMIVRIDILFLIWGRDLIPLQHSLFFEKD